MADNNPTIAPPGPSGPTIQLPSTLPFDVDSWKEHSDRIDQVMLAPSAQPAPSGAPAPTATSAGVPPVVATPSTESDTFDEGDYLKNTFGWDSVEIARQEVERLRNLEKNPPREEIRFHNDDSRKIFEYLRNGKLPEVRQFLERQDRLDRMTKYELSKADEATDVLKAHLLYKNPALTPEEVDYYVGKKFRLPAKPADNLDLTPEENRAALEAWQSQVADIQRDMIIEAKLVRPELEQLRTQLQLPELERIDPAEQAALQQAKEREQALREGYLRALDSDLNKFSGFDLTYKDDEAEIPLAYRPSQEQMAVLRQQLQEFNVVEYFGARWFEPDGKPRMQQIAADIFWTEHRDQILQKFVNEAGSQRLIHRMKQRDHSTIGKPQGTWQPENQSAMDKQIAAVWEA